jgi:hypothetical protein
MRNLPSQSHISSEQGVSVGLLFCGCLSEAITRWGHANLAFEGAGKVTLITEAARDRNIC